MAAQTEQAWLESVRAQVLRGDLSSAQALLTRALAEYSGSVELRRAQAGVFQQTGRTAEAEAVLLTLLAQDPGDAASAFSLARTLKERGRMAAAAAALRGCLEQAQNRNNPELVITGIELLDDCDRRRDAFAIAETAISSCPGDPRLHAYAGMLAIQSGEFERARWHYLFALDHDERAFEWHVPIGLVSTLRYPDAGHPDLSRFHAGLQREGLSKLARAELHFALGKAHDDFGDYAQASHHFRQGNAIRHRETQWSPKAWRRLVAARLSARTEGSAAVPIPGFTPIFIVGMPRTGTTLLAELLAHYPTVCNRGELAWLARLAELPVLNGKCSRAALQNAALKYAAQSRQDEAAEARWFIDKQPLNFRHVDLALAMFPDARIIRCVRNPRDTALSLWMQCFLEDVQGYAYDFDDIGLVARDEQRLMAHWRELYPETIQSVRYEELVADPRRTIDAVAAWIGLPSRPPGDLESAAQPATTISTASLWQARQPVNTRSVDRWKNYAAYVPELLRIPEA